VCSCWPDNKCRGDVGSKLSIKGEMDSIQGGAGRKGGPDLYTQLKIRGLEVT